MRVKQALNKLRSQQFFYLAIAVFLSACASYPPIEKAASVDAKKFVGDWYVIANIPYFAERNKVGSKTTYRHRKGNLYDDIFEAHDKNFDSPRKEIVGKVVSLNEENTVWRSTFYWVLKFKFSVIHVDPEYQIMLLGHESRKYGWIMSRSKTIPEEDYLSALSVFEDRGYDTKLFSKVPQLPEQVGKPRFQQIKK